MNNTKLYLFIIITAHVLFLIYNESFSQNVNNLELMLQKEYVGKNIPIELYKLTSEKLINKKTSLIIYLPSKICFSCAESIFQKLKNRKEYTLIVLEDYKNPSIIGLIKYNGFTKSYIVDQNKIFRKLFLKNFVLFSPLLVLVHKQLIKNITILNNKTDTEKYFKK